MILPNSNNGSDDSYRSYSEWEKWCELYEFQKALRDKHNISVDALLLYMNVSASMKGYLYKLTPTIYPNDNNIFSDHGKLSRELIKLKTNYNGTFNNIYETPPSYLDRVKEKYHKELNSLHIHMLFLDENTKTVHAVVEYDENLNKILIKKITRFILDACAFLDFEEWKIDYSCADFI